MLRTVLFYAFFWAMVVAVTPIGVLAALLRAAGLGRFTRRPLQRFGRVWARAMIAATGSRVETSGLENLPASGGVCFVGNHEGTFDTLLAMALIDRPFGFTAKKEALLLPFIGPWVWLLGGVFIDRKSAKKAFKAIKAGAAAISSGGAMIIFPEGTRNRGRGIGEFRAGALKLATMAGAPIVPVAIDGSWKVWEEAHRIRPARVRIAFGAPIATAGLSGEAKKALSETVKTRIVELRAAASSDPASASRPAGLPEAPAAAR
jgi:1-acyl-sn-glycerol-3-phosphate acyltransferase